MASEPPLVLAFDTSAAHCAAALVRGPAVLAARHEPMDRGQAERLLPMLEELMAEAGTGWTALDGIGVVTGPGNFTGVRLAVAAARGLALGLGIPAVGVSIFEALADRPGEVDGDARGQARPLLPELPRRPGRSPRRRPARRRSPGSAGPRRHGRRWPASPPADLTDAVPPAPLYLRPADALPSADPVPAHPR